MNAILYLVRTGVQWRYVPGDFPSPFSVSTCYRRWRLDGTLDRMHDETGCTTRIVQAILGHSSVSVTARYSHLQPDVMERAMEETFG